MYLIEEMVDDVVVGDWKSKTHRDLAIAVCIGNSQCHTKDALVENIKIIQKMTEKQCRSATVMDLRKRGCTI